MFRNYIQLKKQRRLLSVCLSGTFRSCAYSAADNVFFFTAAKLNDSLISLVSCAQKTKQ